MDSVSKTLTDMVMKIMEDGNQRSTSDIRNELERNGVHCDTDYNRNHLSGVIMRLKTKGDLNCVERGMYCIASETTEPVGNRQEEKLNCDITRIRDNTLETLVKAYDSINEEINSINLSIINSRNDWTNVEKLVGLREDICNAINRCKSDK